MRRDRPIGSRPESLKGQPLRQCALTGSICNKVRRDRNLRLDNLVRSVKKNSYGRKSTEANAPKTKPRRTDITKRRVMVFATATAFVSLAGCVEDTGSSAGVAPGRATLAQVEQSCIARLAAQSQVSASAITVTDSTGSSEGTAVFLSNANGAPWVCRADGAGNITALDFQGEG
ncbi:hypothetical protein SAMN06295998_11250 [Primorskyibacter flagellatus]|uniref:Uncharacterized protein n=1 Tax=Primorskyibacter flagellatus TaxID=1387277 RepID=A0A1W2DAQ8_9RHOB|nr:hypothetical protein SAMN06295998_11250 [Primorskyibacter flagellatus]